MGWNLSLPLLIFAGTLSLLPLAAVVCRPTSAPRLLVGAFVTTLAAISAFWLAWVVLRLFEQRW